MTQLYQQARILDDDVPEWMKAPLVEPEVLGQPGAPLPGLGPPDLPPQSIFPTQQMGEFQPTSVAREHGLRTIDRQPKPGSLLARFGKVFATQVTDVSSLEDVLVLGPLALKPDVLKAVPTSSLAKEAFLEPGRRESLLRQMGVPEDRIDRQGDIVQLSQGLDELRRQRIQALGLTTEPPKNIPETIVDTAAGLAAFITQLIVAKKLLPKAIPAHLRDAVAWEVQNIATGGPPGEGAAMALGLGTIQALPIPSPAKLLTESAAFGVFAKAQGASDVDFYIALAIPSALRGMGAIRAKLDIDLRAAKSPEAVAKMMTRAKDVGDKARAKQGVSEPTLEEMARGFEVAEPEILSPEGAADFIRLQPESARKLVDIKGIPSQRDFRGLTATGRMNEQDRVRFQQLVKEQLDARSRTQEQATRQPTKAQEEEAQPQIEARAQEEVAPPGTAQVRALDRSTGTITDVTIKPENTVKTLKGERKTLSQLRRVLDCLGRT